MKTENGTNTILLIIGIIILVYKFSEPISEQFILNDKKCPVYNHTPKLISIVHHPKLNKGFIILVSCKKANSIIQTSLKNADGLYTIKSNGKNEYLLYNKGTIKQNIVEYSMNNYEYIKSKSGLELMGPT